MISKLLEYQKLDKKRIEILRAVEGGKAKQEINVANKNLSDARNMLLSLEEDAKGLTTAYETTSKILNDLIAKANSLDESKVPNNADEIQSASVLASALLQKINGYENQLEGIAKNINAKSKAFEDAKNLVIRAQTAIKNITPQYEKQMESVKPQLDAVRAEMDAVAVGIEKSLLERYKARRKTEGLKMVDVVVPVVGGRCGGCMFEMPLALAHAISTNGFIVCEECGRIIYKAN